MVVDPSQPGPEDEHGTPVVICVDGDLDNLNALGRVLRPRCNVMLATSGQQALELLESQPDVAAVFAGLPMPAGADLLARISTLRPHCRRVVVTGSPDSEDLVAAIEAGHLHHVVTRPWRLTDLLQVVEQLLDTYRLERVNVRLRDELRTANVQLREHELAMQTQLSDRGREISAATEQLAQMGLQLNALTLRDPLTGLYTHLAFQERMREEVARALRYSQPMALLIADIDSFASVNSDLGYQAGDDILRTIASILIEDVDRVRTSDIVARYSGEEFVLLLPETSKAGALTIAGRICDAVAAAKMPNDRKLTISIGVACLPEDAADPESLLTAAESALRGAKRVGTGRVHDFSAGEHVGPKTAASKPFNKPRVPEVDRFRPYQERMADVTSILSRDRSLSCLLVDLSRLHRVELDLGVAHHSEIYDHAAAVLDQLRGAVLDPADIICRSGDGDGYFVILAPRIQRLDLEALAQAVERAVEEALVAMVSEVLREQPRIVVGAARVLGNSLLRPERLTARLISDATESARNLRERKAHRDRSTLQDVILGEGLTSVYQPIVDLGTGDVFAFEALTRGPRGTALESPATLFAIAEEVDLTVELDRACFRGALRSAQALEPVHRLFVNLLPMSFYDHAFIEVEVGNLLSAAGLTPANIVFEITERLAIENFTSFKRALGVYTAMGFGIAIDDVGTRHSNLETVMSLRPHFIKISDVLVRGIARSTVKREMMRSLRHIAETIDAVMIAEGIEQVEDVEALRDLGLRYGQGYYMARPGPPFPTLSDAVRARLRSTNSPASSKPQILVQVQHDEDEDEDEDRDLPIPVAKLRLTHAIPRNVFGRPEEEITSDFALPDLAEVRRARGSEPPADGSEASVKAWQPLSDDEATDEATGEATDEATDEALLASLKRPGDPENAADGKPGGGRPGLN